MAGVNGSRLGTQTPEYIVFRKNLAGLVRPVSENLSHVAREAFSKTLISEHSLKEAINHMMPAEDRATMFLTSLLGKIEGDDRHFDTILLILREIPTIKSMAVELQAQVQSLKEQHSVLATPPNRQEAGWGGDNTPTGRRKHEASSLQEEVDSGLASAVSNLSVSTPPPQRQEMARIQSNLPISSTTTQSTNGASVLASTPKLRPHISSNTATTSVPLQRTQSAPPFQLKTMVSGLTSILITTKESHEKDDMVGSSSSIQESSSQSGELVTEHQNVPPQSVKQMIDNSDATIVKEFKNVNQELRQTKAESKRKDEDLQNVRKELTQQQAKIMETEKEKTELEEQVCQLEEEIRELKEKLEAAENNIELMEIEKNEIEQKKDYKISTLEKEIKDLKEKLADKEKEKADMMQSHQAELTEQKAELTKLEKELAFRNEQKRADIAEKGQEILKLKLEMRDMQDELKKKNDELQFKEHELNEERMQRLAAENKALAAENEVEKMKRINAENEINQTKEKLKTCMRRNSELEEQLQLSQSSRNSSNSSLASMTGKAETRTSTRGSVSSPISEASLSSIDENAP